MRRANEMLCGAQQGKEDNLRVGGSTGSPRRHKSKGGRPAGRPYGGITYKNEIPIPVSISNGKGFKVEAVVFDDRVCQELVAHVLHLFGGGEFGVGV